MASPLQPRADDGRYGALGHLTHAHIVPHCQVAQMVEQAAVNRPVGGSMPSLAAADVQETGG